MIWLIIILAFILRIINLNQSLWWDEAINIVYARSSDFWWFVTKYPVGDFHPPGWFAILWVWAHIFGFSEIASRLPSVFLGVATVWFTCLLGKELFSRKVGLLAALFLAIAPLHVYYSEEARMYVFAAFAVTLSFYFLPRLIASKRGAELGYLVSLILVLYSDYLAYLIIPAQIVYLIWIRKLNKKVLVCYLIAVVTLFPWLKIFPLQLQTGFNKAILLPGWEQVVGGSNIKDLFLIPIKILLGRAVFVNKTLNILLAGFTGAIFGSLFIIGIKKLDQSTKFLLSWIFIPIILAFVISFFVPVLSYFRMIFILPAFYLILGKSIESLSKKIDIISFIFICLVSITSLAGYYLKPQFQREDWRGAINFVSQNLDKNTLVIFENNEISAPAKYYSHDLTNFRPGLLNSLKKDLENKNKLYFFEYLADVYDPDRSVEQEIKSLHFIEAKTYDFHGVGFIKLYVR